jgi:hypothetical protein
MKRHESRRGLLGRWRGLVGGEKVDNEDGDRCDQIQCTHVRKCHNKIIIMYNNILKMHKEILAAWVKIWSITSNKSMKNVLNSLLREEIKKFWGKIQQTVKKYEIEIL